ncbi:hypothetical protein diail_10565 [Diaporthe ilicicola]|nr:hypothetical protein diail_10565 [Diaporthe ilicicola]
MVPTSALRETIVLVIFGIILVPIAAKRAQDAPGYWKAFTANTQQSLAYHDRNPWTSALMLMTAGDDTMTSNLHVKSYTQNETALVDSAPTGPRPESKGPLTIRFRLSKSEEAVQATTAELSANAETTKVPESTEGDVALPPTTTSAANRERWTLIWTGTAIAAVALFMSFC